MKDLHKNLWASCWLFNLSLFTLFIIYPFARQDMFIDGVVYAALAKNMAHGFGSLWHPSLSSTFFSSFYEHPPLALYFESLFFKLLGDGVFVEKIYCLILLFAQWTIMAWYWVKKLDFPLLHLGFLLLIWFLCPLNLKYDDNLLELTLTFFTTAATFLLLIKTYAPHKTFIKYIIGSALILISFFSNGPVAFFVLSVPFLNGILVEKNGIGKALLHSLILTFLCLMLFKIFFYLVPEAWDNTKQYFFQQVISSLKGLRGLKFSGIKHLHILEMYFRAYWRVSFFGLICFILASKISKISLITLIRTQFKDTNFILFLFISLVAALPVGISPRQAFSYLIPNAPFGTLAAAIFCYRPFIAIVNFLATNNLYLSYLSRFAYVSLVISVSFLGVYGGGYRDHGEIIQDLRQVIKHMSKNDTISISSGVYFTWYTMSYLARYSEINLTRESGNKFYLALKKEPIPSSYHIVDLPLSYYNLAEK